MASRRQKVGFLQGYDPWYGCLWSNSWFYTIYLLAEINGISTFQNEDIKLERKTVGEREVIAMILIKTHFKHVWDFQMIKIKNYKRLKNQIRYIV